MLLRSYENALRDWQTLVQSSSLRKELRSHQEIGVAGLLYRESKNCVLCKSAVRTQAHIFPRSQGGSGSFWNLLILCNSCNRGIDSQIIHKHRPIESKYDPYALLAESELRYSKGEVTIAAKLAKIAALIRLEELKPSDFLEAVAFLVKYLRASIHYEELLWSLDVLALSVEKAGRFLDRFIVKYAAAQILAHDVNIGALKLPSHDSLRELLAEEPTTDREWRLRLKALWLPLLANARAGNRSATQALESLAQETAAAGEWPASYHIKRSIAWIMLEEGKSVPAFDLVQDGMAHVRKLARQNVISPHAYAEELRAISVIGSIVKDKSAKEYLRMADSIVQEHGLRLWNLEPFPLAGEMEARLRNTAR